MSVPADNDRELAGQARAGSLAAFEELVRRYEGRIYRFAHRLSGDAEDARDITQEAFVRAYRMLDRYDPGQEFGPWLFTIARRKALDQLRARRAECRRGTGDGHFTAANDDNDPTARESHRDGRAGAQDPAEALAAREETGVLWHLARASLSAAQFQALWLHYAEDLNTAEVAAVMGISRPHAKILIWRARSVLARRLRGGSCRDKGKGALKGTAVDQRRMFPSVGGTW